MTYGKKPCTRCLLEEAGKQDVYASIQRCIEKRPEKQRTASAEYDRRLEICRGCEHISEGTCLKCGCYVEFRAAFKNMKCPNVKDRKW